MTKKSKGRFSEKGKCILQSGSPRSIGDLLPDQEEVRQDVNTEVRQDVNTEETKPRSRHELRLSYDLSERLRKYVYETHSTKTAVIETALMTFLDRTER